MNVVNLIPDTSGDISPFLFFDKSKPRTYKIYSDGSHHIGVLCVRNQILRKPSIRVRGEMDEVFDGLFLQAVQSGIKIRTNNIEKFVKYITPLMLEQYAEPDGLTEWLTKKVERAIHNYFIRERRFKRKAYLNRWNYFVTFTYDEDKVINKKGDKQTEEQFRKRLRKQLSNLHTRHGWKYMGVFERAPITGRLHFHGILYVPNGEMVGEITEKQDYSTAKHEMQTRHENSYFEKRFGVNDFQELSDIQVRRGNAVGYILKYIGKTGDRVVYSRDIPTEIYKELDSHDIAGEIESFVTKYLLFDDVIDWERDVLRYRYTLQMRFDDFGYSPPLTA